MVYYKGYRITVLAGQKDDGKWIGHYQLLVIGLADAKSMTKEYLDDTFDSEQEALTATENAARA
jgi:hypothetical protein